MGANYVASFVFLVLRVCAFFLTGFLGAGPHVLLNVDAYAVGHLGAFVGWIPGPVVFRSGVCF